MIHFLGEGLEGPLAARRWAICFIMSFWEIPDPAVSLAAAEVDRAFKGWLGEREEVVEAVDGVVQEIVVGLADPDVQLAPELRAQLGPVGFQYAAEVIRLPVLGGLVVDHAGLGVPERDRAAVRTAGPVGRVPGTPLAAGERPGIAVPENVFDLALVPHRVTAHRP